MKPKSVFLAENTNLEIEEFLQLHHTVYIPVGAMEQHGPHSAIGTDVVIPQEIARRVCERQGNALVAAPLTYTLSYPHRGFISEFSLSIETFMAVVRELALSFGKAGFKRIVFLNGHYDNTYALAYACAQAAERLPEDARAYPLNYWDGMPAEVREKYSSLEKGMHANAAETSAILAINPKLVDMEKANAEFPNFPEFTVNSAPVHTAFFFSNPRSVYWATKSGTWGDARSANPQTGEDYINAGVDSTIAVIENVEKTFAAIPRRP